MLNKAKIGLLVGAGLMLIKQFFPGLPLPEGAEEIVTRKVDAGFLFSVSPACHRTAETELR